MQFCSKLRSWGLTFIIFAASILLATSMLSSFTKVAILDLEAPIRTSITYFIIGCVFLVSDWMVSKEICKNSMNFASPLLIVFMSTAMITIVKAISILATISDYGCSDRVEYLMTDPDSVSVFCLIGSFIYMFLMFYFITPVFEGEMSKTSSAIFKYLVNKSSIGTIVIIISVMSMVFYDMRTENIIVAIGVFIIGVLILLDDILGGTIFSSWHEQVKERKIPYFFALLFLTGAIFVNTAIGVV